MRVDNLMEFQDLRCSSENDDFEEEEEEREERAKDEEEEKEMTAETEVEDVAMEEEEEEGREKEMRGGENKTADTKSRRKKKEKTEKKQSGGRGLTKSVLISFEGFENILWFLFQDLAGDVASLLKVHQPKGSIPTGGPPQPLHEGEAAASE